MVTRANSVHVIEDCDVLPLDENSPYELTPDIRPLSASEQLHTAGQELVHLLNERLLALCMKNRQGNFVGQAPEFILTIQSSGRRKGSVAQSVWSDRHGSFRDEISLCCECHAHGDVRDLSLTLVQCMVILTQLYRGKTHKSKASNSLSPYRNRQYADWMWSMGLWTYKPGKDDTVPAVGAGLNVRVMSGSTFDRVIDEILSDGFAFPWEAVRALPAVANPHNGATESEAEAEDKPKDPSKVKFSCPSCGLNAWAKQSAILCCGGPLCGTPRMLPRHHL